MSHQKKRSVNPSTPALEITRTVQSGHLDPGWRGLASPTEIFLPQCLQRKEMSRSRRKKCRLGTPAPTEFHA